MSKETEEIWWISLPHAERELRRRRRRAWLYLAVARILKDLEGRLWQVGEVLMNRRENLLLGPRGLFRLEDRIDEMKKAGFGSCKTDSSGSSTSTKLN